jgi:mannose-6-phosphate isomerase-like protein (cupin superfamily)
MAEPRIVRNGEGDVLPPWLCKIGSCSGARFDFLVGTIDYLSGPPLHVHRDQDDTFYVLEGVLTVQVGEEVIDLGPGDFATVPPGVPHTFTNIRKDDPPPKVCNLMTPGGLDALIHDLMGADAPKLADLGEKHGFSIAGPPLAVKLGLA